MEPFSSQKDHIRNQYTCRKKPPNFEMFSYGMKVNVKESKDFQWNFSPSA